MYSTPANKYASKRPVGTWVPFNRRKWILKGLIDFFNFCRILEARFHFYFLEWLDAYSMGPLANQINRALSRIE